MLGGHGAVPIGGPGVQHMCECRSALECKAEVHDSCRSAVPGVQDGAKVQGLEGAGRCQERCGQV